jgi:hypothetical protein
MRLTIFFCTLVWAHTTDPISMPMNGLPFDYLIWLVTAGIWAGILDCIDLRIRWKELMKVTKK